MRRLILETPRLQLCEMVLDDFKSLSLILQDENVMYAYNGAFRKPWHGCKNSSGVTRNLGLVCGACFLRGQMK